jgi:hypothetical protein
MEYFVLADGKGRYVHITGIGSQGGNITRNFGVLHQAAQSGCFSHYIVTNVNQASEFETRLEAMLANVITDTTGVFNVRRSQSEDQCELDPFIF